MTARIRPASLSTPYSSAPELVEDGVSTWLVRGARFVVAVSAVKPGARLSRADQPDEYMLILPAGLGATIRAGGAQVEVAGDRGDSLVIVPPGNSVIEFRGEAHVTRLFSNAARDMAEKANNAALYADEAPDLPPLGTPPPPPGGFKIRHYVLEDYNKPDSPARPFRSTNLMVNMFVPRNFRRDVRKMTPHAHDDFEQASLALQGRFVHHLRYPWESDMTAWREDEHIEVGIPSVIVMPARVVHTTQDVGEGYAQLIDIFAPPRADFAEKPGFVCNEDEYPLP